MSYQNIQKKRNQTLQIANKNNAKLSQKMHNYVNNIQTEDLDEATDDRSNYERNQNSNEIRQQIGQKVYKLFANDTEESEQFMNYINENGISIQDFNLVFSELIKNSAPNTNTADNMIMKINQLLDDSHTGPAVNSMLLQDIYNLIKTVVDKGDLNEEEGSDLVDRVEASVAKDETKMSNIQSIYEKNLSNINKIDELHNITRDFMTRDLEKDPTTKELKAIITEYNKLNPDKKKN